MTAVDYSKRFFGGFEDHELALWRHLRDEGGYWVAGELLPTFPQFRTAHRLGGAMKRLFNGNHLARRTQGQSYAYGVTTACRAPQGQSMVPGTPARRAA